MISGLSHITLSVRQLSRSYSFYVDMLGCRPIARWPRGAYLTAGDLWLCLIMEDCTRSGPLPEYTYFAFHVADDVFDELADRIRSSGATIFQDNVTEGPSLYFLDPGGHKLEIHIGDLASRMSAAKKAPWEGLQFLS